MYQQSKKKDLKLSLTVIVGMQFYEEKIEKKSIFRMCSRTALYFKYFVCIFFQLDLNFTFCKCKALFSNLSDCGTQHVLQF